MIDLDEILYGKPTMAQVAEFWKNGEFYEERYLVQAIEKWLLTEDQRKVLFDANLSIEKILNGECCCAAHDKVRDDLCADWNVKLGFKAFGM